MKHTLQRRRGEPESQPKWPSRVTVWRWRTGKVRPSKRNEAVVRVLELLRPLTPPAETDPPDR